jgi:hypothetical protein
MKKRNLVLLVVALLSSMAMSAQVSPQGDDGTVFNPLLTGVPSLVIAPDARGGGLGDVGAATSADINSQYWNPAKYAQMESRGGFAVSYTPWLRKIVSDIDLAYLAGYYKLDERQSLAASFRYFSLGEINLTSEPDAASSTPIQIGIAQPYELAVDLGYSRNLSEHWSAAVALRFIYSDLTNGMNDDASSYSAGTAMGADVAAYYVAPVNVGGPKEAFASFGLNISNIGTKISYDRGVSQQFIPTNLRLGGAFEYPFDEYNTLTLAVDLNKLLVPTPPKASRNGMTPDEEIAYQQAYQQAWDDYEEISSIAGIFKSFGDAPGGFKEELEEVMWSAGLEYAYDKKFLVRGGYFHESQNKGNRTYFAFGVGFNLSIFQLNAAYLISTAQTNPLDQTLRFSLGFDLDGIKNLVKN